MCSDGFKARCEFPRCRGKRDCRWDPFCKACRHEMYDNLDENVGRPKYEIGD